MQKLSIELPKHRFVFHYRFIKRRKPLLDEPIIPSVSDVKKKYRTGTIVGKFVRYISEHKNTRKILAGNFAAVAIVTSFLPSVSPNDVSANGNGIIQAQTQLVTEKGTQVPINHLKINQSYNFFHPGLDLGGLVGEIVKPVRSGFVVEAGYTKDGYGNNIVVDHGNGLISRYAHLSKITTTTGAKVSQGALIGYVGSTGRSTGPHLHFEVFNAKNPGATTPMSFATQ